MRAFFGNNSAQPIFIEATLRGPSESLSVVKSGSSNMEVKICDYREGTDSLVRPHNRQT